MLREIWNSRCKIIFDNHYKNMDLAAQFKQNIKRFLVLEKNRLHKKLFKTYYAKNNVLCSLDEQNQIHFDY